MVNNDNDARANSEHGDTLERHAPAGRARTKLVNSGQDTQITLSDGSTIVLKGVTHLDVIIASNRLLSPIGAEIGDDG
jgi:hypothetical protein